LDDKMLLVEIHLIECRTHYALQNIPKSKAALTASKTNANAIHCPPLLQADIDLWSGVVTAKEKDFRTSYSYFYEAFEAFNAADKEDKARNAMKYMLLAKIMYNRPEDTTNIINSKTGLKYTGPEIDAMAAVAKAHKERSLKKFEAVREQYKTQLDGDLIVATHLSDLNETMLEQNVLRILEPFSRVEVSHVAELLELPLERTQSKLREMILDQKLNGTLDQGVGVPIVFDQETLQSTYSNARKQSRTRRKSWTRFMVSQKRWLEMGVGSFSLHAFPSEARRHRGYLQNTRLSITNALGLTCPCLLNVCAQSQAAKPQILWLAG